MKPSCTQTHSVRWLWVTEVAVATTLFAAYWLLSQPSANAGTIFAGQASFPGRVFAISPSGSKTPYASASDEVTSMAVDHMGDLFFATGSGTILKQTPGGAQTTFATAGGSVYGMAFNTSGDLYVTSGFSIFKYSPTGVQTLFATDENDPAWLGFGPDGSLFVVDRVPGFGTITKYSPTGASSVFASHIQFPRAFAIDGNGNVFLEATNDLLGQEVFEYSPSGTRTHFAFPPGWAWSFAVDPTTNQLFGSFGPNSNFFDPSELIYKFDSNGIATVVTQVPYAFPLAGSSLPEPSTVVLAIGAVITAVMTGVCLKSKQILPPTMQDRLD